MASKFSGVLSGIRKDASKVKTAIIKAVAELDSVVLPDVEKYAPEIEAVANVIVPGSATYVQIALSWAEDCAAALDKGGAAVESNLTNAGLDTAAIQALKSLIPTLKAVAAAKPATAAPASSKT
jgi:hypothetical protein